MLALATTMALTGVLLGFRFKIFVLAPAALLTVLATIFSAIAHADGVLLTIAAIAVALLTLQLGFLCGSCLRHVLVARTAEPDTRSNGVGALQPADEKLTVASLVNRQ